MKFYQMLMSDTIGAFMYLFFLLSEIDFVGILDYGIKAALGSLVWLAFRLLGDYLSRKLKRDIDFDKNKDNP